MFIYLYRLIKAKRAKSEALAAQDKSQNQPQSEAPWHSQTESQIKTPTEAKSEPETNPPCEHRDEPSFEPCPECRSVKKAALKYRWKIILGLVWPFALQAIDSTVIASALPWIASDFGEISELNWIVSAFNLTAAAFIPCWAQLAEIFGRTACLNAAIFFMLVGSAICTGAPTSSFPVLLLGRGLQGLAGAGLNVCVRIILADRVSLRENAANWAIFSFVGGISYALGPVIGGYLADTAWRWCFAINLPIGVFALVVVFFVLRKELLGPQPIPELDETTQTGRRSKLAARLKTVDIGGQFFFLFGFGLLILAFTWAGADYEWESAAVLTPLVLGVVMTGCFLFWERAMAPGGLLAGIIRGQRPMIPWALLTNRDICLLFYAECTNGIGMYAVLYFCNIYFIAVEGRSADESGVQLLYFTPGLAGGVILCNFLIQHSPRMTFPPIFLGTVVEAVGLGMLARALYGEKTSAVYGFMAMVGAGTGLRFMASPLHGVGLFRHHRAALMGLFSVAVPFGGTLGLTIMSTIFNNVSGLDSNTGDFSTLRNLPAGEMEAAIHDAKMGVVWSFVGVVPFALLAWIGSFFLGNVQLGKGTGPDEDGSQNIVTREPYLWSLLRGRR